MGGSRFPFLQVEPAAYKAAEELNKLLASWQFPRSVSPAACQAGWSRAGHIAKALQRRALPALPQQHNALALSGSARTRQAARVTGLRISITEAISFLSARAFLQTRCLSRCLAEYQTPFCSLLTHSHHLCKPPILVQWQGQEARSKMSCLNTLSTLPHQ